MAVAFVAMAFTAQNASAQLGLQLTPSVSTINLGTVPVNSEIPLEFNVGIISTGDIFEAPYVVSMQIDSKQNTVEVRNVVLERLGIPTWKVDAAIKPTEVGNLSGEALEITMELPIPLLPNIILTTEIPLTGTVVP
ncbi:hypothetical protein JCM10512_258 [Bacteroides reticulotermitis JCM 10512]|uniref:Uncharacterized protein n=2 Tax=Bacteroides reticulotermitis TaxID=1133319 RepID=W4UMA0_9BACE|nr:hypothetical protein JCM10512_258 [Bacteroides reticulotermitis JCM 10512]